MHYLLVTHTHLAICYSVIYYVLIPLLTLHREFLKYGHYIDDVHLLYHIYAPVPTNGY